MLTHGLSVSRETSERLELYVDELLRWQKRINLIGPADREEVWERHIADCWQVAALIPDGSRVVDMGAGAGLPGIVVAIRMAETGGGEVTLVEANGKKCAFLNHMRRTLALPETTRLTVSNERVQTVMPALSAVDVVTARAFASLTDLLSHSCLSPDSHARRHLFPKGRTSPLEIDDARRHFAFDLDVINSSVADQSVVLDISNLRRL
ncbi:MAG: 16S rRNA (guanine(527)-N(7))-methyltransferase RsmG [Pseudomonadota bacterium]